MYNFILISLLPINNFALLTRLFIDYKDFTKHTDHILLLIRMIK